MTTHQLIDALRGHGATIALKDGGLVLRHGRNVPEALMDALRGHKPALLMLLQCGALFTDTMTLHDDYYWRDPDEGALPRREMVK